MVEYYQSDEKKRKEEIILLIIKKRKKIQTKKNIDVARGLLGLRTIKYQILYNDRVTIII